MGSRSGVEQLLSQIENVQMSVCALTLETQPPRCVCSSGAFNQRRCSGVKLFSLIQLEEYLSQCLWKWGRMVSITPSTFFKTLIYLKSLTGHLFSFSHQQLSMLHTFITQFLTQRQLDYSGWEEINFLPNHLQVHYSNLQHLKWFHTRIFFLLFL